MKAPRDIIKHVGVEVAERGRKCHRNQTHHITRGEKCIVVKEGAFNASKNYCVICALEIVLAAQAKLTSLRCTLEGSDTSSQSL